MAPPPNLHEDEKHDTDGNVRSKHDIADPQEHPSLQIEANLSENGPDESEQGHPKAPSNSDSKVLGHVDAYLRRVFAQRHVRVDVNRAGFLLRFRLHWLRLRLGDLA